MHTEWNLAALIERGGIYYQVPGTSAKECIAALVNALPPIPAIDSNDLLREIMEREELMSTGVGRGIALPHPRNPLLGENDKPFVAAAFPTRPIDWNTQDGSKVHTVFLIVSSSAKQHLNTLSNIHFLCQQEKFNSLIGARASPEVIIAAIREAEANWAKN